MTWTELMVRRVIETLIICVLLHCWVQLYQGTRPTAKKSSYGQMWTFLNIWYSPMIYYCIALLVHTFSYFMWCFI